MLTSACHGQMRRTLQNVHKDLQFVTNSMSQVHHIHILNSDHMQFYFLMQMSDCSPFLMEGAVITRKPYLLHGL